ncbi:MAG: plasmid replication protein, CyRepA1 family [Cyanobacteriota bacterium]
MNHLQEWGEACVDDQLTRLNVIPLNGACPSDYLLYADALPRRNDGRVSNHILKRYEHTEQGGWWCSGIDLLTLSDDLWGCFKPSQPRRSVNAGKLIKYEHPPLTPTGVFALRVPLHLWYRIADRYSLTVLPEEIDSDQPDQGFWQWLINHPEIPLCITEGAKKAGALLTAGYAAIGLSGVFGGYRVPRDEQGNRIGKSRLIPQLLKLATPGREIYLAFDQDSKPKTIKAVNAAIRQLGYLISRQECFVKIITWNPEQGKGVDDLIAAHTQAAFDEAYQVAVPLDTWKAQSLTSLTYPPDIQVNCRYLGELPIPEDAQLIGIKSPKGTGKTLFLEGIVKQALDRKQWVLVIGHRVRLVESLCQRFGLNYVTEVRDCESKAVLGYGLCLDSLHPDSQARFNAYNWSDGVVIIDEVEQVLWHGLDSSTCSNNRVAILKSLKTLMQNVLGGDGQVFVADADLSDVAIDYLVSLSGVPLKPFIIQNDWKPGTNESWQVHSYTDNTPERLVKDLERHIKEGGKPFVCLSAQKRGSHWSTCTLETYLQQQFPEAKILRIDSESLSEPTHPAYGCMTNLDRILPNYDIILASPAIETGVSIEIQQHFTSVWGIAQGIQSENSVRQALGRVRENLPRFLWVAPYGFNRVGNGSTSIPALLTSSQNLTQLNIRLLQQSDFDALDDLEMGFQAESLLCWAKMAVRHNAAMLQYRESVLAALRNEGHQIIEVSPIEAVAQNSNPKSKTRPQDAGRGRQNPKSTRVKTNALTVAIAAVRDQNYQVECEAIANSEDISDRQYQALQKRLVKTLSQRRVLRKHELKLRYGIPVTPQLVAKDDEGWYQKLLLHYFLTFGREQLAQRDAALARRLIKLGGGSIFLPDFNRSQLGAAVGTMELLGIPVLLQDEGRELNNTDEDLRAMSALALSNRASIKTTLGIGLAKNSTPITIVRRLLDKIGYGITCIGRKGKSLNRVRVYQVVNPHDGRVEVFQQWLAFDGRLLDICDQRRDSRLKIVNSMAGSVDLGEEADYVQLCLSF